MTVARTAAVEQNQRLANFRKALLFLTLRVRDLRGYRGLCISDSRQSQRDHFGARKSSVPTLPRLESFDVERLSAEFAFGRSP